MAFKHKATTLAAALGMMAVASSPALASDGLDTTNAQIGWACGVGGSPAVAAAVADLLGVSEAELIESARRGRSLADVAESRGVQIDVLVPALLRTRREATERAVAAGKLGRREADAIIELAADKLGERVTDPLDPQACGLPPLVVRPRSGRLVGFPAQDRNDFGGETDLPPAA